MRKKYGGVPKCPKKLQTKIEIAQLLRFENAGFSQGEAELLWKKYKTGFLTAWREYIAEGLIDNMANKVVDKKR